MTARVLVVDDLLPNVKLLEAKLRAEYFEVICALSGQEAVELAQTEQPDIILLDVMMPGMDGFATCGQLKSISTTCHIPVVMVTALDQQADRVAGLEAGADDFLSKPVEDVALFARVRSLTRLKMMTDEMRMRHATSAELGIVDNTSLVEFDTINSRILVVQNNHSLESVFCDSCPANYTLLFDSGGGHVFDIVREQPVDLIIIDMALEAHDPLRLCSTFRSIEETRLTPVLVIAPEGKTRKLVRALDMGVSDYLTHPIDVQEMNARIKTQLRRKHYNDQLRSAFHESLQMAVTDQLTGLYNRRYMATHASSLFQNAKDVGKPLSVMMLDVDHFKSINDQYGHDIGDKVLQTMSSLLRKNIRGIDLACRFGGEEFAILLPDTPLDTAHQIAERLRQEIAALSFDFDQSSDVPFTITVSIGVAGTAADTIDENEKALLKRADEALYKAKQQGRNRVVNASSQKAA